MDRTHTHGMILKNVNCTYILYSVTDMTPVFTAIQYENLRSYLYRRGVWNIDELLHMAENIAFVHIDYSNELYREIACL